MEDFVAESLSTLVKRSSSEADVKSMIIRPVLKKILNYSNEDIFEESTTRGTGASDRLRPDYRCGGGLRNCAELILEAKSQSVDIFKNRGPDEPIHHHPLGQLANYLTSCEYCTHGTIGVLSNGRDWAVMVNKNSKAISVDQFRAEDKASLEGLLRAARDKARGIAGEFDWHQTAETSNWIDILRELAADNQIHSPKTVLQRLLQPEVSSINFRAANTSNHEIAGNMPDHIAAAAVGEFNSIHADLFGNRKIYQMCIRPDTYDDQISPSDITSCLRDQAIRHTIHSKDRCFGIAYSVPVFGQVKLRGFVWTGEKLQTTEFFDLDLPKAVNVRRLDDIANGSYSGDEVSIPSMTLEGIQKKFHEEIDAWFNQTIQTDRELRHLIRILFVWLLQDRELIPESVLPLFVPDGAGPTAVHDHLEWVFSDLLAVPPGERSSADGDFRKCIFDEQQARQLIEEVPFLNGSIFHRLDAELAPQRLANEHYVGESQNGLKGLFEILAGYQWTLSENSAYFHEVAIDPNMLGELFERLVLRTEGIRFEGSNKKMPDGTYYTPSDVVEEMVCDAIANWLHGRVHGLEVCSLRQLVHLAPDADVWHDWGNDVRSELLTNLQSLTILDPCCGSGAFAVASMQAIARIERRLSEGTKLFPVLDRVIEKQIYAIDKKPLAVSISKLRMYIAIVEAQLRSGTNFQIQPLPNLEVLVIAANTLRVDMQEKQSSMFEIDSEPFWQDGVSELLANRELWTQSAHQLQEKSDVRSGDQRIRESLLKFAQDNANKYPEADTRWLELDMLQESREALELDVRKCFLREKWDIVIGNPPYQDVKKEDRKDYGGGFVTEGCNLYTLFIEVGLKLAKEDGNVTMVVPHSVVFRAEEIPKPSIIDPKVSAPG